MSSSSEVIIPPPPEFAARAHIKSMDEYRAIYERSLKDPDGFWREQAKRIHWFRPFEKVSDWSYETAKIKFFLGGKTNVSYNCLDRHLKTPRRNKAALIWEGDSPEETRTITYQQLHRMVCRFANVLKANGVKKGDTVTIYMPMVPELPVAMLACSRIGAIHNVIFGGFSPDSIKGRIEDCGSRVVITADEGLRGGRKVPLKANMDKALEGLKIVHTVIVYRRTGAEIGWVDGRDHWWRTQMSRTDVKDECEAEPMDSEDPLFVLYTSGSTGKPKGVMHTTAGYLVYVALTHELIFDIKEEDTYWCTADIGWVTGHSYIVYGPLANGTTSLMFEVSPITQPGAGSGK